MLKLPEFFVFSQKSSSCWTVLIYPPILFSICQHMFSQLASQSTVHDDIYTSSWLLTPVSVAELLALYHFSRMSYGWSMPSFLNTCTVLPWETLTKDQDLSNEGDSTHLWQGSMVKSVGYFDILGACHPHKFQHIHVTSPTLQQSSSVWPNVVYYSSLNHLKLVS